MVKKAHAVTIVVPVYADWPSLRECILSLKQCVDTKKHRVMLVNDCGPEAEAIEDSIKKLIKLEKNFYYYKNEKNLGFVGTCNRAVLELDGTNNDILLLNSDTVVTDGFLEEMLSVLYGSDDIAVVSPRTNNATIATIPLSAAPKKGIKAKKSYKIFKKIKPFMPKHSIVPVAHGFCLLVRREVVKKLGLFDPIFGKGYGEEVDFCMRIGAKGYKSALSNWSYVFHLEARSFTMETKKILLEENNKIIKERYPNYSQIIGDYMKGALAKEGEAQRAAGITDAYIGANPLKRLIKSNQLAYRLVRTVLRRIKG